MARRPTLRLFLTGVALGATLLVIPACETGGGGNRTVSNTPATRRSATAGFAQITATPTPTPSAHSTPTSTPHHSPTPTPNPIPTSSGNTGVSVGFDVAFDLATATPWNDITEDDLFAIQTTAGSGLDDTSEGVSSINVPQWVANVHAHHRLALITIGGIADQHWEIACNATYRSAFVTNLVTYMKSNGFDGIDLDIEDDAWSAQGPPSAAMNTCAEAIASAAHATTTAAGARPLVSEDVTTPWMGSWVAPFQSDIDQFNLMTYGDSCANSCSQFASDIQSTIQEGVTEKSKFVLGIDLIDTSPQQNDPADCGSIANYALQQGFAGVMVWDIHGDAVLHNGHFPCFDQIAPYVVAPK